MQKKGNNMKKLILVFAMMSACHMHAMELIEDEQTRINIGWSYLPNMVNLLVLTEINKYDDPDDIINAIKKLSLTDRDLNKIINTHDENVFLVLVDLLVEKITCTKMYKPWWDYHNFFTKCQNNIIQLKNRISQESNALDDKRRDLTDRHDRERLELMYKLVKNQGLDSLAKKLILLGSLKEYLTLFYQVQSFTQDEMAALQKVIALNNDELIAFEKKQTQEERDLLAEVIKRNLRSKN